MGVHEVSGPGEAGGGPFPDPRPPQDAQAVLEAWRQVLVADQRVEEVLRTLEGTVAQLERRKRHVLRVNQVAGVLAATTRPESLGNLALEVLGAELGSRRGGFFALEGAQYLPVAALGAPLGSLVGYAFPAPNPFPDHPLVLFQTQFLDYETHHGSLNAFQVKEQDGLLFVPFEHQLFLMGFAVLALPRDRSFDEPEQELLEVLQHLFAMALNNAWLFRDLQQQRTELALQAGTLRRQAESLAELQAASHLGRAMKSEFLVFASQEMARQLTDMLGLLRLGQGGAYSGAEAGTAFQEAFFMGQHMQAVLDDLTALVRSGEANVSLGEVPTQPFFAGLAPRILALPRRPGVEVLWPDLPPDLPPLRTDAHLLGLVLVHLLHSALFLMPDEKLALHCERTPASLVLGLPLEGRDLRVEARALAQGEPTRESLSVAGHAGTGLSLFVCQSLLERLGASLRIEAGADRSEIQVEIPIIP